MHSAGWRARAARVHESLVVRECTNSEPLRTQVRPKAHQRNAQGTPSQHDACVMMLPLLHQDVHADRSLGKHRVRTAKGVRFVAALTDLQSSERREHFHKARSMLDGAGLQFESANSDGRLQCPVFARIAQGAVHDLHSQSADPRCMTDTLTGVLGVMHL